MYILSIKNNHGKVLGLTLSYSIVREFAYTSHNECLLLFPCVGAWMVIPADVQGFMLKRS